MRIPETFAGAPVIGVIKIADDPTEHPNRLAILTHAGRAFGTHQVAWSGSEWASGQGHYDMAWTRALDDLAARAKDFLPPEPVPLMKGPVSDPVLDLLDANDTAYTVTRDQKNRIDQILAATPFSSGLMSRIRDDLDSADKLIAWLEGLRDELAVFVEVHRRTDLERRRLQNVLDGGADLLYEIMNRAGGKA